MNKDIENNEKLKNRQIENNLDKLFWGTCSLPALSILLIGLLQRLNPNPNTVFTDRLMWVIYLLIFIDVLFGIIGVFYIIKGVKCTQNILISLVIIPVLIFLGNLLLIDYEVDYKEFYIYENIIDCGELPDEGTYINLDDNIRYVKFDKSSKTDTFKNNIKNNKNWVKGTSFNKTLKDILPWELTCSTCYHSLYIKELDLYNTYPTENGDYTVLLMIFNDEDSSIEIYERDKEYLREA